MSKAREIIAVEIPNSFSMTSIFTVGQSVNGSSIADIIEEDGKVWIFDENDEIMIEIKNTPIVIYYADAEDEEM